MTTGLAWKVALAWLVLSFALFSGSVYIAVTTATNKVDRNTEAISYACEEVEKLKSVIRLQVERGIKSLPTIAYYREHPEELARARAQNAAALKLFAPGDCP